MILHADAAVSREPYEINEKFQQISNRKSIPALLSGTDSISNDLD